jgi:hypothetical protein
MTNTITDHYYDKANRYGQIVANGYSFPVAPQVIGYSDDGFTPKEHLAVTVANDWNMSNQFQIVAATMKGLLSKINRHPHRLVGKRIY